MSSDAVGLDRKSKVVGYKITKGIFQTVGANLPQRIAIFGEANVAAQAALVTDGTAVLTAQKAGELYGFGSPIHTVMRILKPISGDGVGGIPVIVYAQAEAAGATTKILEVTPTGVATGAGTHTLKVAGRTGVDGVNYDFVVSKNDTTAEITAKISDAINAVLGCPMSATSTDYEATLTSKWKGLTAEDLSVTVDTNDNDLGITYAVVSTQSGAGTPSIASALTSIGDEWATIAVNGYGTVTSIMDAFEDFNGIADPNNPTGRYSGIIMKPLVAITGSVADDPSAITDARKLEMTIALAVAPLSAGMQYEAAANLTYLQALTAQNTPELDITGQYYPDMPTPTSIGSMASYDNRDAFVKKGCSTVELNSGVYKVADFVTTYHPDGENPAQFAYVRNLMLDWNVYYGYYLLEQQYVVDHVITSNDAQVKSSKVIKPKQWLGVVFQYSKDLGSRGLIAEPTFMQDSIVVNISTNNPDRLETFFRYKRSGIARIASTTAEAGFNFGS